MRPQDTGQIRIKGIGSMRIKDTGQIRTKDIGNTRTKGMDLSSSLQDSNRQGRNSNRSKHRQPGLRRNIQNRSHIQGTRFRCCIRML